MSVSYKLEAAQGKKNIHTSPRNVFLQNKNPRSQSYQTPFMKDYANQIYLTGTIFFDIEDLTAPASMSRQGIKS